MNEYMLTTFNLTEYQYYPALLCFVSVLNTPKNNSSQMVRAMFLYIYTYTYIKIKVPPLFNIFNTLHRTMLYINRAVSISSTYLSFKIYKVPLFKKYF